MINGIESETVIETVDNRVDNQHNQLDKQEILNSIKFLPDDSGHKEYICNNILQKLSCDISCLHNAKCIAVEGWPNNSTRFEGIEIAKKIWTESPNDIIIICSIFSKRQLEKMLNEKGLSLFKFLMGKENIFFTSVLMDEDEFEKQIINYMNKKHKNDIGNEGNFRSIVCSEIHKILHDAKYQLNYFNNVNDRDRVSYMFDNENNLSPNLIADIDKLLLFLELQHPSFKNYTREEKKQQILDILKNEESPELPEGTHFKGVFIDRDGCLYNNDTGQLNDEILKLMDEYEKKGLTVHIRTGGNLERKQRILDNAGYNYRIVSKSSYKGASVDIIVDNDCADKIYSDYKVRANKYKLVNN